MQVNENAIPGIKVSSSRMSQYLQKNLVLKPCSSFSAGKY